MYEVNLLFRIVLMGLLGALAGLRNEITHARLGKQMIGGVRTYALLAILGFLVGLGFLFYGPWIFLALSPAFALISIYYWDHLTRRKATSLSMELSALVVLLIGVLVGSGIITLRLAGVLVFIVVVIMTGKSGFKHFAFRLDEHEFKELLLFALLFLLLLPYLPNANYSLADLLGLVVDLNRAGTLPTWAYVRFFNPFKTVLIVSLVSFINLAAYILVKFGGSVKYWIYQAVLGGIVSSTTTTVAIIGAYRVLKNTTLVLLSILLANLSSFVEVVVLVAILVTPFLRVILLPTVGMFAAGAALLLFISLYNKKLLNINSRLEFKHSMDLLNVGLGVKFALLFVLVRFIVEVLGAYIGTWGVVASLILLGITGVDIATLNAGFLFLEGKLSSAEALAVFVGVNLVNFAAKLFYIYMAKPPKRLIKGAVLVFSILSLGLLIGYAAAVV